MEVPAAGPYLYRVPHGWPRDFPGPASTPHTDRRASGTTRASTPQACELLLLPFPLHTTYLEFAASILHS